jgi:hypothetical protein
VWLAFEPRNADWGFEEFLTKFAKPHWAVEAKRFFGPPPGARSNFQKRARSGAMIKQTTNKDQTKLQRLFELV